MKKFYLIFAVFATFLVSCDKETTILEEPTEIKTTMTIDGIEVGSENGYLVLRNINDASDLVRSINNYSDIELESICKNLNYLSAYTFRVNENMKALSTTNENELRQLIEVLKIKGYFNEEEKELQYPFYNTTWHTILNHEGIVKIGDKIFRFFEDDKLYNENNDLTKLLNIHSKNDYPANKVIQANDFFPILKSLTVTAPSCTLSQNQEDGWESIYDDGSNETSNSEYRIKSKMYFSVELDYYGTQVLKNWFCIEYRFSKKGIFGIWFDDSQYLNYIFHDMTFGGNPANSSGTINHSFYDFHSSSVYASTSEKSQHQNYFYLVNLSIPYLNYIPPICTESSHQYWNIHIPYRAWMTIHD